jgi:hypothetical protein
LPAPLAPVSTVNHEAVEVAVHAHAGPAVTPTVPLEALALADTPDGAMAMSHVPAWSTVNVRPEIVRVPVRGDVDVLAAAAKVTAPLPPVFGPPPEVTLSHVALLNAVHTHPVGMVTETTREPPIASSESAVEDRDAVQDAAPCVTVSRRPATAIVPVRTVPAAFTSTW